MRNKFFKTISLTLALSILLTVFTFTTVSAATTADYDKVKFNPYSVDWFWTAFKIQENNGAIERLEPVINVYSEFGAWRDLGSKMDLHQGIDLTPGSGTYGVFATRNGVVIKSAYDSQSMGNYVTIYHGIDSNNNKPLSSTYMHMKNKSHLKVGDEVKAGDFIGYIGGTPFYGVHLHFHLIYSKTQASVSRSRDKSASNYLLNNYLNTNPKRSDLDSGRFDDSNNKRIDSGKANQELCVSGQLNYVFTTHTCTKYETYKNGSTKVLGACKECHKAYKWQDSFSRVTNQTASLKSSKKNYKISVYNAPYEDGTKTTAKNAVDKFAIVGTVKNAYGNEWYAIDYPDDVKKVCYTAYIHKSTLAENYDIVTTTVQEAKKYDSANVSTKKHTHNYNYDNGRCYCGEQKQAAQQTYEESTLKINLTQYPSQHTQGNNFGLRGTISSNYKIKKIYGYIKQNGNVIQSTEDTPNAKSVDVKKQNLNNNLVFDRLSPGNYTLEVQAVDASGNSIRVSKDFTVIGEVVRAESTLSINLEKYPVTLNAGSGFGLRGSVNSNYDISVVRGYVINSNGQTVLSSKDTPYSSSLNIKSARLNNDLVFNNLSAGNYTLKVVATDSSGRTVEVSKGFSVVSPQKSNNSTLSINLEKYPVTLKVGSSYGLRGSITSNYNISVVRGYVTNSSGQTVLSSKDTPNSTYMDIKPSNLNWDLVFNNLSAGSYTMKVVAVDASGRTVEATKNFTVKTKEVYVDNSPNGNGVTGTVNIPSSWDNLSIRSGPSTNYQIVGSMNNGAKCTVYPNKTSNGWYYVNYNGIWGYASGNQINLNTSSSNTQTQNTRVGIVNIPSSWDNLSIRSGPSTNYQIVGSMNQGVRCTVYPDKTSNGWYYVEYNGVRGYASGKQINLQ